MARRLRDKVVVITGASSGIGRATALAFARKGANVVLGARRAEALEAVAAECASHGVDALSVQVDVSREEDVRWLAGAAMERFGKIDVWLNNAAVTMFSRFEDAPPEAFRRVFDVNFFGYVHGARVALPLFREQGHGVLINNSSIVGKMGAPYLSAYVSTKFAIQGLTECLREEVMDDPRIHVCAVLPASIDTPIFHSAANYTGRAVKPLEPILPPEKVARAIVRLARRPRRQVVVGRTGRLQTIRRQIAPAYSERKMAAAVHRDHFGDSAAGSTAGNLFGPNPAWTHESGAWRASATRRLAPSAMALTAAALGAVWLFRSTTPGTRRALAVASRAAAARALAGVGRRLTSLMRTRPGSRLVMVLGPPVARRLGVGSARTGRKILSARAR